MSNVRFTRPDRFPPIVKNLIIINVLAWIAQFSRPILVANTAPNAQPIPIKDSAGNVMLDAQGAPDFA